MRIGNITSVTFAFLAAAVTFASNARAEQEFDVSVAGGQIVVTAKTGWHINQEFPWKLVIGEQKLDKSKFSLTESKATVSVPKGKAHLKGAVCSAGAQGSCKPFERDIEIK